MIFASVHAAEHLELIYWLLRTGYAGWLTLDIFPYREEKIPAASESFAWVRAMIERIEARGSPGEIGEVVRRGKARIRVRLVRELLIGRRVMATPLRMPDIGTVEGEVLLSAGSRRRGRRRPWGAAVRGGDGQGRERGRIRDGRRSGEAAGRRRARGWGGGRHRLRASARRARGGRPAIGGREAGVPAPVRATGEPPDWTGGGAGRPSAQGRSCASAHWRKSGAWTSPPSPPRAGRHGHPGGRAPRARTGRHRRPGA